MAVGGMGREEQSLFRSSINVLFTKVKQSNFFQPASLEQPAQETLDSDLSGISKLLRVIILI